MFLVVLGCKTSHLKRLGLLLWNVVVLGDFMTFFFLETAFLGRRRRVVAGKRCCLEKVIVNKGVAVSAYKMVIRRSTQNVRCLP